MKKTLMRVVVYGVIYGSVLKFKHKLPLIFLNAEFSFLFRFSSLIVYPYFGYSLYSKRGVMDWLIDEINIVKKKEKKKKVIWVQLTLFGKEKEET